MGRHTYAAPAPRGASAQVISRLLSLGSLPLACPDDCDHVLRTSLYVSARTHSSLTPACPACINLPSIDLPSIKCDGIARVIVIMLRSTAEVAADNAEVVARLVAALENEDLSDMDLLSERDGKRTAVPAFLLASCSPVFRQMLTGSFAEGIIKSRKKSKASPGDDASTSPGAPLPTVNCAFSSEALAAVVTFAATNDCPALSDGSLDLLLEILEVATYYDIDGLHAKASRYVCFKALNYPVEACGMLDAVWNRWKAAEFEDGTYGVMAEAALSAIDLWPDIALTKCGCLCEDAMKFVLSRRSITADEMGLFRALRLWVNGKSQVRELAGMRLVSCVALENMSAVFLQGVVRSSGLVPSDMLCRVASERSVLSESSSAPQIFRRRTANPFAWSTTKSLVFPESTGEFTSDVLDCCVGGESCVFEFLVESKGSDVCFGLLVGDIHDKSAGLYGQPGLVYSGCGNSLAAPVTFPPRTARRSILPENMDGPKFGGGDSVFLTIDCESNTFSIQVNNGNPHTVFRNIEDYRLRCRSRAGSSYRLAASCCSDTRIRLVHVKQMVHHPHRMR